MDMGRLIMILPTRNYPTVHVHSWDHYNPNREVSMSGATIVLDFGTRTFRFSRKALIELLNVDKNTTFTADDFQKAFERWADNLVMATLTMAEEAQGEEK